MGLERKREKPSDEETLEDIKPKKLRLIVREKTLENHLAQISPKDVDFSMRVLLEIRNFFPLNLSDSEVLFSRLLEIYPVLTRDVHRLYVIEILSRVLSEVWFSPAFPTATYLNRFCAVVEEEDDDEAVAAWLCVIRQLVQRNLPEHLLSAERPTPVELAERMLKSDYWKIRAVSLEVITQWALERSRNGNVDRKLEGTQLLTNGPLLKLTTTSSVDDVSTSKASGSKSLKTDQTGSTSVPAKSLPLEKILVGFTTDLEPRVRAKSIELLLLAIESGLDVTVGSYEPVWPLLHDDDEVVRRVTAKLVWRFAQSFPESCVKGQHEGMEIRLLDDAFSKLCGCMHDTSIEVRSDSAEYLGTLDRVSEKFLEQTLDKKLLPKMRLIRAGAQRFGRDGNFYSDFATGRVFGADAPAERAEEDLASLIPSGSCGAFITGLEDEYAVVREASVMAVGNLSAKSTKFSLMALDFLADMFNDEIDTVRLRSISCLKRICENIELKEEQIEIILKALDEFSTDSRNGVRELLSVCRLSTIGCLRSVLDSLLANLKRYPGDKKSIWNCLKHLGSNHPGIVAVMTVDLLEIHPFFESPEPDIDNPAYVGILILVVNAAAKYPPIKALFLHHTWRHYKYLRHSMSELVPCLTAESLEYHTHSQNDTADVMKQLRRMIVDLKSKLTTLQRLSGEARLKVLQLLTKDVNRIGEFAAGSSVEGEAKFLHLFMRCQSILEKINSAGQLVGSTVGLQKISEVFKLALQMEYLFSVTDLLAVKCVSELKLRSAALLLQRCPDSYRLFIQSLHNSVRCGSELGGTLAELRIEEMTVRQHCDTIGEMLRASPYALPFSSSSVAPLKQELLDSSQLTSHTEHLTAEITEPTSDSDQICRFTAGLVAAVNVVATFKGFNEALLRRVRIRVTYPDQKVVLVKPRMSHYQGGIDGTIKTLRTQVLFSHSVWTEANTVDLQLLLVVPEDLDFSSGGSETDRLKKNLQHLELGGAVHVKMQPKSKC